MSTSIETAIAEARASLRSARQILIEEIRAYPTPISGCDAQFNHLLALRRRVSDALDALDAEVFVPTPRTPSPQAGVESR
ncbi:hypothetical protein [Marivita hallyeonensis]|uniref:Uncharacterized protein n=1 Tax=Marivita hallyeonensis TaxID=996342 RepID=A0A1M5RUA9_9RHOB|nr:hypothetical protein [Marivita hallyeonensis]SHH29895.1 hypothetical protein SAMN05443551_1894 [Marivita hallyeonensis]